MLCTHLHNAVVSLDRITRRLHLREDVSHWLLNVRIFARFCSHAQNGRVRVLWGGNDDRIDIVLRENIFQILVGSRRTAIVARVLLDGFFAADVPQIANSGHLYIMSGLMLSDNPSQLLAPVPRANMC